MLESLGESIDEERRAKSLQRLLEREERQMEEWIEQMERSGRDWQMKLEMKEEEREEEEKKLKALEEEMAAIVRAEEAEAAALTETEEQAIVDTCIDTDEDGEGPTVAAAGEARKFQRVLLDLDCDLDSETDRRPRKFRKKDFRPPHTFVFITPFPHWLRMGWCFDLS